MKKNIFLLVLVALLSLNAQHKIRVASYNIHNYPNGQDANIKKIVNVINPDVLVVEEMLSQAGINQLLNNALSAEYKTALVNIRGSDNFGNNGNDCAFYYKNSVLTLIESKEIPARTRVISKFKLVHNVTTDTIIILGVHLKANDIQSPDNNKSNEVKRDSAITSFRKETNSYKPGTNYLVCGDFNIFRSDEAAFQKLTNQSSSGYVVDMMNAVGNWSSNISFSSLCTYSPSYINARLDMILISPSLIAKGGIDYVDSSFKIFGNDGNHFNMSIISGDNSWFISDPSIGTAVVQASDHLPIYADFQFGVATNISDEKYLPAKFELYQNYPNPFNPTTDIRYEIPEFSKVSLKVYDVLGREVVTLVDEYKPAGSHSIQLSTNNLQLSSGIYFYRLTAGSYTAMRKMILVK